MLGRLIYEYNLPNVIFLILILANTAHKDKYKVDFILSLLKFWIYNLGTKILQIWQYCLSTRNKQHTHIKLFLQGNYLQYRETHWWQQENYM